MAEISQDSGGHKKGKKSKQKKVSTRIDLTPMVDLAFLLITFFMLATTLIKPQTMEIAMPSKDTPPDQKRPVKKPENMVTILIDKNDKLYYYVGMPDKSGKYPTPIKTDYSPKGLRTFLLEKNSKVVMQVIELKRKRSITKMSDSIFEKQKNDFKSQKNLPFVVIKATDDANYKNLVDVLDEMQICNIPSYAIDDIKKEEIDLIKNL